MTPTNSPLAIFFGAFMTWAALATASAAGVNPPWIPYLLGGLPLVAGAAALFALFDAAAPHIERAAAWWQRRRKR